MVKLKNVAENFLCCPIHFLWSCLNENIISIYKAVCSEAICFSYKSIVSDVGSLVPENDLSKPFSFVFKKWSQLMLFEILLQLMTTDERRFFACTMLVCHYAVRSQRQYHCIQLFCLLFSCFFKIKLMKDFL